MIERPHTENIAFPKKGRGEMALLIEQYKWESTPLGSMDSWPSELRNTVNIMLHSSFPMFLYWGKELICFYNDAFRPSLGKQGKHPDILGMQGKDAWPEIWDTIQPLIMNVFYSGDSSMFEDRLIPIFRNGNLEDVFWTFGYTPVKDQDGQNQGVLVICNETTRKVNKFHKVVEQSKAPIAIFKGHDLIVEEANQATLDLWRLNRDVIGKPLLEVVPEMRDQGFAEQLQEVLRTGEEQHGIEAPAYFKRDDGSTEKFFFNFEFSPFKEANGTITGVMVLSTNVTQQVVARNQLAIAEQEIRLSIEAADLGYWNYDPYANSFNCNERTRELFNLPRTEHVDIETVMNAIHPADADYVVPAFQNALKFEHAGKYNIDYRVIRSDKNDVLFVRAIGRAYFDNNKKPFRFSGTLQDITELKKAEESFNYRKALLEAQNNTIPDGILIVDTKGKILSYNKRFAEIWNMPQEIMDAEDDNLALQYAMEMMPDPDLFITRVNYLYSNFREAAKEEIRLKDGRVLERYGNAVVGEEGKRYGWAWYFRDITEKKKWEDRLRRSEEIYRSTFENAAVGIAHVDPEGRWLFVNDKLCNILGYRRDELLTLLVDDLTHPDDIAADHNMIPQLIEGKMISFNMEKRYIHKNNSIVWVDTSVSLVLDNYGNPEYFIAVIDDITQRIKAEVDLKRVKAEQEELLALLESLLKNAPIGFALVNREMKYVRINETLARMNGFAEEEHIGRNVFDVLPDFEVVLRPSLERVFSSGQAILNMEVKGITNADPDRTKYWLTGFYPITNERNKSVDFAGAIVLDITDRKNAEAAILQSEERFRTLANSIQNMAWMADKNGHLYWYNERWFEYTGATVEDMDGWGWENFQHPDYIKGVIAFVNKSLNSKEPWELTAPLRRHDGEYRWFLTRAIPIKNENGEVYRWIGTNTDIDDQKSFTEKLESLVEERTAQLKMINQELQRSNEDLQQFAHVASHDLKEPVRKIKTFSGRLKFELHDILSERANLYLDKIEHSVDRMYSMIDGVLMYSSLNALKQINETIDLNLVIHEIESDFELLIQQKKAIIRSKQLPSICGSGILIYQLFYNLIGNSLKFTRADMVPVIEISGESSPEQIKIVLKDNGIGFDQIYGERIFQTFSRLHPKDLFEGTGLGLTLCKNIVERHGGNIRAEGKENEGATFTIILPTVFPPKP